MTNTGCWGFPTALTALKQGAKVRRSSWVNSYVQLDPEDGVLTFYPWAISQMGHPIMYEADSEELMAEDWEIVE